MGFFCFLYDVPFIATNIAYPKTMHEMKIHILISVFPWLLFWGFVQSVSHYADVLFSHECLKRQV